MNKIKLNIKLELLIDDSSSVSVTERLLEFTRTLPEVRTVTGDIKITSMTDKSFENLLSKIQGASQQTKNRPTKN